MKNNCLQIHNLTSHWPQVQFIIMRVQQNTDITENIHGHRMVLSMLK